MSRLASPAAGQVQGCLDGLAHAGHRLVRAEQLDARRGATSRPMRASSGTICVAQRRLGRGGHPQGQRGAEQLAAVERDQVSSTTVAVRPCRAPPGDCRRARAAARSARTSRDVFERGGEQVLARREVVLRRAAGHPGPLGDDGDRAGAISPVRRGRSIAASSSRGRVARLRSCLRFAVLRSASVTVEVASHRPTGRPLLQEGRLCPRGPPRTRRGAARAAAAARRRVELRAGASGGERLGRARPAASTRAVRRRLASPPRPTASRRQRPPSRTRPRAAAAASKGSPVRK